MGAWGEQGQPGAIGDGLEARKGGLGWGWDKGEAMAQRLRGRKDKVGDRQVGRQGKGDFQGSSQ